MLYQYTLVGQVVLSFFVAQGSIAIAFQKNIIHILAFIQWRINFESFHSRWGKELAWIQFLRIVQFDSKDYSKAFEFIEQLYKLIVMSSIFHHPDSTSSFYASFSIICTIAGIPKVLVCPIGCVSTITEMVECFFFHITVKEFLNSGPAPLPDRFGLTP